jgi:Secretion system C-terminal sorting domain/Lamin Tail Domain
MKLSRLLLPTIALAGISFSVHAQDHLLLSEVVLQQSQAEFIEIYNPTDAPISLDNYYLADNQEYPFLPSGIPTLALGDFIVKFPAVMINAKEALTISMNGVDFETYYGPKADFEIYDFDALTTNMIITVEMNAILSNAGEGIALFYWNGIDATVQDVDLMNVGVPTAVSQIVDKSGIAGYQPDAHTIPFQIQAPAIGLSTKRILLEDVNELHLGTGNGITGDDETSEDITVTWDDVFTAPNPGSTVLSSIGIEIITETDKTFNVYPNPATSEINLSVEANNFTIEIRNSQGVLVEMKTYYDSNSQSVIFNLSQFKSGIYYVMYKSETETLVERVTVI